MFLSGSLSFSGPDVCINRSASVQAIVRNLGSQRPKSPLATSSPRHVHHQHHHRVLPTESRQPTVPRQAPAPSRQFFSVRATNSFLSLRFRKNQRRRSKSTLPNRESVSTWPAIKAAKTSCFASCLTKQQRTVCDNQRDSGWPGNCCDVGPSVWFATCPVRRGPTCHSCTRFHGIQSTRSRATIFAALDDQAERSRCYSSVHSKPKP